jgi:outer membrane protein assembly factor BamB
LAAISLAILVLLAGVGTGVFEAVKHLGKDQPILVITDETTVTTEATTNTTRATAITAPTDTGAAMVGGNAARTGVYPDGGPTERPDLLWKLKIGDWEGTSPVVSDGVVYVAGGFLVGDKAWYDSPTYLYALDARSGEERWRFPCPSRYSPGGPAVSEGVVYIGGYDGYLYALDTETGQEIWKFQSGGGDDTRYSSPVVADGVVYFGSLYALDAASGQVKWDCEATGVAMHFYSSPAVSDGLVYFDTNAGYFGSDVLTSGGSLYALDAQTGQEKWTSKPDDRFWPTFSPVVSDGVVYFGNEGPPNTVGDYLHAFDAQTGEEKWVYENDRGEIKWSSPAVSGGVVYLLYETYDSIYRTYDWLTGANKANALLVALDATSGRELWQFGVANAVCCIEPWSSPSISGNVVYLHTCQLEGDRLHALDASTGEELWTWLTSLAPFRHVASSSPAISDGVVYFSGADGYLYALK